MNSTGNPRIFEVVNQDIVSDTISEKDYKGIVVHHAQYTTSDSHHLVFNIDEWHKEKGHLTFIISSCPDIYISLLTEHLGCDGYECSRLFYENTKFIGRLEGKDCIGVEKVQRLKSVIKNKDLDLANSYAYSDHESDLPLLELVGIPIAVSPTKNLRRIATHRGWKIEEW